MSDEDDGSTEEAAEDEDRNDASGDSQGDDDSDDGESQREEAERDRNLLSEDEREVVSEGEERIGKVEETVDHARRDAEEQERRSGISDEVVKPVDTADESDAPG